MVRFLIQLTAIIAMGISAMISVSLIGLALAFLMGRL